MFKELETSFSTKLISSPLESATIPTYPPSPSLLLCILVCLTIIEVQCNLINAFCRDAVPEKNVNKFPKKRKAVPERSVKLFDPEFDIHLMLKILRNSRKLFAL